DGSHDGADNRGGGIRESSRRPRRGGRRGPQRARKAAPRERQSSAREGRYLKGSDRRKGQPRTSTEASRWPRPCARSSSADTRAIADTLTLRRLKVTSRRRRALVQMLSM